MKSLLFLPELSLIIAALAISFDESGITSIVFLVIFILLDLYRRKKIGEVKINSIPLILTQVAVLFFIYKRNNIAAVSVITLQCIYLIFKNFKDLGSKI